MKKANKSALRWILANAKTRAGAIIAMALIYAFLAFLGVFLSVLAKTLIDSAVAGDLNRVIITSFIIVSCVVMIILLNLYTRVLSFKISTKLEITLKTNLFKKLIKKDYSLITNYHSVELLNRLTSDVSIVSGTITSIFSQISFLIIKLLGVFFVLFCIDYKFALVFLAGGVLILLASRIFKNKMKGYHKKAQETDGRVKSFLQETIESLLVVKVFGAEKKVVRNVEKLQQEDYKVKRKRSYLSIFASTGFSLVFSVAYFCAMIWGAFGLFNQTLTYGTLTAVLSLVSQIQGPISGLSGIIPQYYSALASAERIMEIESLKDEGKSKELLENPYDLYNRLSAIEFEKITFGYKDETVFENASLTISKGDYVIVSGISGIGKSTLTRLLLSVYFPKDGRIFLRLDSGECVPVDGSLRRLFSYVPQGNFLLSGTIRDNITFIRPDASEDDINRAVKISCADEFINNLPDGLNTVIGERGGGLSEGQVQRIAIARAVICNAPVMILDEVTSALDAQTEERVLRNLREYRKDLTCIIISHKSAAYKVCNKEIKIKDKKIITSELMNGEAN